MLLITTEKVLHTIVAYVMSVVGLKTNLNQEPLNGNLKVIRKKPHVTYAALKVYLLVKLPSSMLTVI